LVLSSFVLCPSASDVVEIGEPGDLLPGDHEDVAVRDGLVGADRDAHVVGPDEAAGDLACDDS